MNTSLFERLISKGGYRLDKKMEEITTLPIEAPIYLQDRKEVNRNEKIRSFIDMVR